MLKFLKGCMCSMRLYSSEFGDGYERAYVSGHQMCFALRRKEQLAHS